MATNPITIHREAGQNFGVISVRTTGPYNDNVLFAMLKHYYNKRVKGRVSVYIRAKLILRYWNRSTGNGLTVGQKDERIRRVLLDKDLDEEALDELLWNLVYKLIDNQGNLPYNDELNTAEYIGWEIDLVELDHVAQLQGT